LVAAKHREISAKMNARRRSKHSFIYQRLRYLFCCFDGRSRYCVQRRLRSRMRKIQPSPIWEELVAATLTRAVFGLVAAPAPDETARPFTHSPALAALFPTNWFTVVTAGRTFRSATSAACSTNMNNRRW
jgi:hypothetical protein